MAIIKGTDTASKINHYKALLNNPFWIYLMGISTIFFIFANSTATYLISIILLTLNLGVIAYAYLGEELQLHNKAYRHLKKLDNDFIILPSMKITDGYEHGCTSYVVISPRGVFNIKILDFTGVLTGNTEERIWDFIDYRFPYHPQKKRIKNPLLMIDKSHKILEGLLNKNHIDYLFIRSILVVKSNHSIIHSNTNTPIIKLKDLNDYLMGYQNRHQENSLLDIIASSIIEGQYGGCCKKLYCTDN
ncbi:nuclease-related domain-containing protein [Alkaliphilus serpentinus]|uniref:NERD domain-containing protein n=1 Tax=Alkaliphilus serpentinus TaxID=1482731 RepID=A0A833MF40_9FIRM|nr:nuclease-related domain-containing protein [Alkaliphilus serpentinus]KAB3532725.1 NERD domain-containing protein [Alkaliphilus serpentinus]